MEIRDLTHDDIAAATVINNANVPAVSAATEAALTEIFDECAVALGAFDGERLVGFCLVLLPGTSYRSVNYRWFSERYERFGYLDRVAFHEAAQGKGLGAAMYREVEAKLAGLAELFTLEVNLRPRNDGSLRFHVREGFEEVGQLETDYGHLVSLMAKPLA